MAIDIKALDDFEQFQESVKNYEANQWQISQDVGMKLIKSIRKDQGKVIDYSVYGENSLLSFSLFKSKEKKPPIHNCITWCREKLKRIGILIPQTSREILFILPEDVIQKPNQIKPNNLK